MSVIIKRSGERTVYVNGKQGRRDMNGNWHFVEELTVSEEKEFFQYINSENLTQNWN